MKNKTLEQKIKLVCWWALGLTILYLLVGAWLISDGPKFDPTKTYNLLKDTLTLTAAFLAPVAAFVLFSDWREQHRNVSDEKKAFSLYQAVERINVKFLMVAVNLQTKHPRTETVFKEIDSQIEEINIEIHKIIVESNSSHTNNDVMKEFLELYQEIIKVDFLNLYGVFGMVIQHCRILTFPEDHKKLYLDGETTSQFIERQQRQFMGINELTLFQELKDFRSKLDNLHDILYKVKV